MRQFFTCIFSLIIACSSYGQNMVVNPSFEQHYLCPNGFTGLTPTYLPGWDWGTGGGSPDYFHVCGSVISGVPSNTQGYQPAFSGSAYAGLALGCNFAEYIKGDLTPLTTGSVYEVTIHVNVSNQSQYAASFLGVFFYQNLGFISGMPVLTYLAPQIDYGAYGNITDTLNWTTLVDTFYADSAYSHILIGSFTNNCQPLFFNSNGFSSNIYCYFDSIIVRPIVLPSLVATMTQTNNICNGAYSGTATIIPSGGLLPYTYLWSNGQTTQTAIGLAAGTYTCIVTDNANTVVTQTITITQPASSVTATITNSIAATCSQQNGSATVFPNGGTPGYVYQWLPYGGSNATANNLGAGTYTVNVADANNCVTSATITINTTPAFTLSTTTTNAACFGASTGSATVTATGGTQPFTYLWSNGQTTQTATNLSAGTYSVTVTDANGCTGTANVNVTQPPLLTVTISSSTNVNCFGQTTGSATVSVSGGTPGYSYLWNNGATTPGIAGVGAGTYTVTVTDTKGCTATASVTITQSPQLNLNVVSSTNASCGQNNGTASVIASGGTPGYTYNWLPTGGTGTSASGLGAGIYTVTVTDTKNCTKTVNITITTSTPLNVTVASSTNIPCFGGNSGTAAVTVTGGTQPYTYQWSSGQTTASVTGLIAGTYSVVVTDANGCAGSATVIITQPTQLVAGVSTINHINCYGQNTGSVSLAIYGGTLPYSFLWSTGSTSAAVSGLPAGTYTCTVTDGNNCTSIVTATITQNPQLNVSIGSIANATCSQNNGWATATVTGGTQPYTYLWNNGQTTQTATNLGAGTYTCNVTDALGCTGSATITITQSAALTLNIASDNISCNGSNNGTATVSVSTGTQPYTYNWSNGGTIASIYNLSAGSYTITVTDAIGCAGTASVTITEPTALTASIISSTDALCNGASTGSAEVSASGGTSPYNYLWSNADTNSIQSSLSAGTYTVIATDSNGCTASASVTIDEPSAIVVNVQSTTNSCAGQAQGTATVSATGGNPPYTYSWNTNPAQTGSTANNLTPGNYNVTATDANGCTQNTTVTIGSFPSPTVDAGDDVLYCYDKETVTLHASGAISYLWSPTYGLSCTACQDPVANPAVTTAYTVTGTDANGCTATDMVTISVLTKDPTSIGATEHLCTGESVQLFASGGSEYSWSPAEGMSNSHIANPMVAPTQTTDYTVIIKQNDCFSDTLTQSVVMHTLPLVTLGPDMNAVSGSSIELHADTSNATTISWTPAFNLSCYDCINPTAFIEKDIRYVVTVSNEGCTAVDDINIRISCSESDIFLANSFTPNNDGNNDYFYPQSAYEIPIAYMAVYDRWGEKIFERDNFRTNDPTKGWDGLYKGKVLEPNVFVYYVQFLCGNGQKVLVKGDVSVVK